MATLTKSSSFSGVGGSISQAVTRSADGGGIREVSLPAGKTGQLTTRTDDNTGTLTMAASHGITTGALIDIYWTGGVQYAVTVGTVSVNSVPFDSGIGDNLPTNMTAIVACRRVQVNADIDGDNLKLIAVNPYYANPSGAGSAVHIDFQDAADDEIAEEDFQGNSPRDWDITGGSTNPFTGDPITKCFASNGSASYDATLQMLWVQDSTP